MTLKPGRGSSTVLPFVLTISPRSEMLRMMRTILHSMINALGWLTATDYQIVVISVKMVFKVQNILCAYQNSDSPFLYKYTSSLYDINQHTMPIIREAPTNNRTLVLLFSKMFPEIFFKHSPISSEASTIFGLTIATITMIKLIMAAEAHMTNLHWKNSE